MCIQMLQQQPNGILKQTNETFSEQTCNMNGLGRDDYAFTSVKVT